MAGNIFFLKEELKALKGALNSYNHQIFGDLDFHISSLRCEIYSMDTRVEKGGLPMREIDFMKKVESYLWSLLLIKDALIF